MRILCPICKGAGWSDTSLATVGTKPQCKPCGGIGTINIFTLNTQVEALREKLERIRLHLHTARVEICESHPHMALESITDALLELGNAT